MIGLGRSGIAASEWLADHGFRVYASDQADDPALHAVATRLRERAVAVDIGRHDARRVREASAVVVSPGVPPEVPVLEGARAAGVEVVGELDLAARVLRDLSFVVVTGTNGKSTTTDLAAHLLRAGGFAAEAAGNIGRPLIEVAGQTPCPNWVVVEASSFQLHDAPHLHPDIGVLTNLAPDHLNRYASIDAYYADKKKLFQHAVADSVWILNADDPAVSRLAEGVPGIRRMWSMRGPADAWFDPDQQQLVLSDAPLLPRRDFPLLGAHNIENALAAMLVAGEVGVAPDAIVRGLTTCRPLSHRLETIRDVDGVRWINDSKATNVASARAAILAMEHGFVWIAGGQGKGEPFEPLAPLLRERCRAVVAYGEAADDLVRAVGSAAFTVKVPSLEDAVERAGTLAVRGDSVLLSPACTSFDLFANFGERGETFRELVEAL